MNTVLDRALQADRQHAVRGRRLGLSRAAAANGHDLSLAVMQAKALRSAVDSGLEVPPEVIDLAIRSVREHYSPRNGRRDPRRSRAAKGARASSPTPRAAAAARSPWRRAASCACRSSASTTTGGSPRTWT